MCNILDSIKYLSTLYFYSPKYYVISWQMNSSKEKHCKYVAYIYIKKILYTASLTKK